MKKATAVIVSAAFVDGKAVVTYESGTTRNYGVDKLPQTVKSFLDHQAEPAEKITEEPVADLVETSVEEIPTVDPKGEPVEEIVEETPEEATEEAEEEPEEEPTEAIEVTVHEFPYTGPTVGDILRAAWRVAAPVIGKAAIGAARAAAKGVAKGTPVVAGWALDRALDAYYGVTTYVPIGCRKAAFALKWDVIPTIKAGCGMAKAFGRGAVEIGGAVITRAAGFALTTGYIVGKLAIKATKGLARGWAFREALMEEQRAA